MSDTLKIVGLFLFYIFLIAGLATLGFIFIPKMMNIMGEFGALIGALIGLIISLALWFTVGRSILSTTVDAIGTSS